MSERYISFSDWSEALDAESGLSQTERANYKSSIIGYLAYLKRTHGRASNTNALGSKGSKGRKGHRNRV